MSDICMFNTEGKTNPWQEPTQLCYITRFYTFQMMSSSSSFIFHERNGRLELQAMEVSLPAMEEWLGRWVFLNGFFMSRLEV